MKKGIAGTSGLLLAVMVFALPGCTSVQEYWIIPDDQPPAAGTLAGESSGLTDRDSAEDARNQEEAMREAEARENARKEEEDRLQREEEIRRESEAWENARREEEARLQEDAARREAEARENARLLEEAALRDAEMRESARLLEETARRDAEAQEYARKQEEVRRMLENLETTHRQAEAEEAARQETERRGSSGGQAAAAPRPRYYVVREGDTFSSIAANPRIYSNRSEWFTLYQANVGRLENPDNPDLLAPGTVIEIPSISGEIREGTY
ncbi:MAG: LysM peptidoglycan-binding domain-containing protein [Spirochaetaceae bacterium]|jgi:nucleoid-associated protein YgaU|nr:LysM peptidoglycan-binding domain-containing protein [Spirochaetaceae bacterium]